VSDARSALTAAPAQREPRVAGQAGDPEGVDADDHREGGPGLDAEQTRVGQRVARVPLHQGAGDAERDADGDRQQGPGHPQVADDGGGVGPVGAEEHLDDGAEREVAAADGQADQPGQHQHCGEHDKAADRAAADRRPPDGRSGRGRRQGRGHRGPS
jgi:hypothetical protein